MYYLIGVNGILFELTDVKKINVFYDEDVVEVYNTFKERIFICNKLDIDFIIAWKAGEPIPEALAKKYGIQSDTDAEEPAPETQTETQTENQTETQTENQTENQPEQPSGETTTPPE